MSAVARLLQISSPATGSGSASHVSTIPEDLSSLLIKRDGFFAFEASLEVFPRTESTQSYSIDGWNSLNLWRSSYGEIVPDGLCFAQDVFGVQFIYSGSIFTFDPETAEINFLCTSIDEWAEKILEDYEILTGFPLAHEWQVHNGPLAPYHRLVPKIPFVLGGLYEVNNLVHMESSKSMRFRGSLAVQLEGLPDGAQVTFEIVP